METPSTSENAIKTYVAAHTHGRDLPNQPNPKLETYRRLEKALSLLPSDATDLILSDARRLTFLLLPNAALPFGMSTVHEGPEKAGRYTILMYDEHQELPEDLFIGSVLRELAHVVLRIPPEDQRPTGRQERAELKERLESRADALVWKWGLRHYNIRFITATYPSHRADEIIESVAKTLLENDLSWD